jgi:hypothetical protein
VSDNSEAANKVQDSDGNSRNSRDAGRLVAGSGYTILTDYGPGSGSRPHTDELPSTDEYYIQMEHRASKKLGELFLDLWCAAAHWSPSVIRCYFAIEPFAENSFGRQRERFWRSLSMRWSLRSQVGLETSKRSRKTVGLTDPDPQPISPSVHFAAVCLV